MDISICHDDSNELDSACFCLSDASLFLIVVTSEISLAQHFFVRLKYVEPEFIFMTIPEINSGEISGSGHNCALLRLSFFEFSLTKCQAFSRSTVFDISSTFHDIVEKYPADVFTPYGELFGF
ncbi:MAG: hypothetical protein CM1200mP3_06340 [Chloroflexota bacterium]|nr:MAG: hypothetical protein CM1200mP3_06340 [Chloroflexota bacterium]